MITKVTHRDFIKSRFPLYEELIANPLWGTAVESKELQRGRLVNLKKLDPETCLILDIAEVMGEFTDQLSVECTGCLRAVTSYFTVTNDYYYRDEICFDCVEKMASDIAIEDRT